MKHIRPWGVAGVWMLIIFLFSSRGRTSVNENYVVNFLFFKTLHVIEYGILFALYRRALKISLPSIQLNSFAIAMALTLFYAASDEFHQTFVSTREGRVRDVIIDGAGATLSWIFLLYVLPKAPKKLREWGRRLEIT